MGLIPKNQGQDPWHSSPWTLPHSLLPVTCPPSSNATVPVASSIENVSKVSMGTFHQIQEHPRRGLTPVELAKQCHSGTGQQTGGRWLAVGVLGGVHLVVLSPAGGEWSRRVKWGVAAHCGKRGTWFRWWASWGQSPAGGRQFQQHKLAWNLGVGRNGVVEGKSSSGGGGCRSMWLVWSVEMEYREMLFWLETKHSNKELYRITAQSRLVQMISY